MYQQHYDDDEARVLASAHLCIVQQASLEPDASTTSNTAAAAYVDVKHGIVVVTYNWNGLKETKAVISDAVT